jgi:predicted metal-binding membrane protein
VLRQCFMRVSGPGGSGRLLVVGSPVKPDAKTVGSWRDAIRAQAWSGLVVWTPALAGWLLLYWGAINMDSPAAQLTMPMSDWSVSNWVAVFTMWAVMMAAMMLPTAMPMVSVFETLNRNRGEEARTVAFVASYLALWTAFGAAATAAQWALQTNGFVSPMIVSMSPVLSGALLVIAGVFQFTPLKHACLRACRTPFGFLMTDWREGLRGATRMGIRHGVYCLGCCWALMALLFVGGAMNLLWIAALTLLVAIEKLAPKGDMTAKALGALMIGAGVARLAFLPA